ncbi:unnamed protein product [Ixodes pacificus]
MLFTKHSDKSCQSPPPLRPVASAALRTTILRAPLKLTVLWKLCALWASST